MHELKPSNTRHEFVPRWTHTTRISYSSWYHHRFPPETLPALINRRNHSLFGCWKSVALSVGFWVVTPLLRFQSLSSFGLLTFSLVGNTSFAFQFVASENHAQNVSIQGTLCKVLLFILNIGFLRNQSSSAFTAINITLPKKINSKNLQRSPPQSIAKRQPRTCMQSVNFWGVPTARQWRGFVLHARSIYMTLCKTLFSFSLMWCLHSPVASSLISLNVNVAQSSKILSLSSWWYMICCRLVRFVDPPTEWDDYIIQTCCSLLRILLLSYTCDCHINMNIYYYTF